MKATHEKKSRLRFIDFVLFCFVTTFGVFALSSAEHTADNSIVIARGQTTKLAVLPQEKIHITNKSVVTVKDQGRYLSITGAKIGYTSVVTSKRIFKLIVAGLETARSYQKLLEFLNDYKGLTIEAATESAVVRGDLLRFSDWEQLANFARTNNVSYSFGATLDSELSEKAQIYFRKLLARAELPPVQIVLEGGVARAVLPTELVSRKTHYKNILAAYGIEIEKDSSSIALAPMVEVEILVAEVERQFMRSYGVTWPTEHTLSLAPNTGQITHQMLDLTLQALESKGAGRILASPKLLCRSGKEAEFLAGGEFPIAVRNKLKSEILWKSHGVILKVKPLADLSGRMSIDIETEVSIVNTKDRVEDLPSFKTNRIKTHFDLEGSRTIVLSGLLKSIEGQGRRGLPILSEIPIIGGLFSSRDFLEERTELVFFVTPHLVPYDTASVKKNLPKWNDNGEL